MRVDVRIKFLLLLNANMLLLLRTQGWIPILLVVVLAGIFLIQGYWRKGISYVVVFLGMSFIDRYFLDSLVGDWSSFGSMLFVGGRVMLPCFMAGSLILSTTSAQEMISVFRKIHIPEGLILTIAVMLRFMPVVRFEFRKIHQSLLLRGVMTSWRSRVCHPVKYFEYCIVPLMMSASRIAQDLAIATLTKGVGIKSRKSIYHQFHFSWLDWIILCYLVVQMMGLGVMR